MVNAPSRPARGGRVGEHGRWPTSHSTSASSGPAAPGSGSVNGMSVDVRIPPSRQFLLRAEPIVLERAFGRQASRTPRFRSPRPSEDTTPVAQMLNTESRTRLMLARLHDLISQLCSLRERAGELTDFSTSPTSRALQVSLGGLNSSLVLLDSAIKDLEDRVSGTARRLDLAVGRAFTDWLGSEPVSSDTHAPGQSPLDVSLSHDQEHTEMLVSETPSHSAQPRNPATLQARLGVFSESLANLNSRLDRIASNFRSMQEFRHSNIPSAVDFQSSLSLAGSDTPGNDPLPGHETLYTFRNHPGLLVHPPIPRLTHAMELSPEEIELQSRTSDSAMNETQSFTGLRANTSTELSSLDRYVLYTQERASDEPATEVPQDGQSIRMQELSAESSTARLLGRHLQEEELEDSEPPSRREPTAPTTPVPNISETTDCCEFPAPKLSSHVPLSKDQARIFVDGIEYRNCLGLWLSYTGEHAPKHALPMTDSDAMEE